MNAFFLRAMIGLLAVMAVAGNTSLLAQTSKGILVGVARDQTGAVVAGATVAIRNDQTGEARSVVTTTDGSYRFDAISPGPYTVDVTHAGFDGAEIRNLAVNSTQVTSYDVTLAVGTAATEISVEANAGTIDTENGQLTGTVSAVELNKLPIFTLNPTDLATTVPGVQPVTQGAFSNYENIQVNGARPRDNNFLLDGQEINDVELAGESFQPQIPDSFDSVNVITNSSSAEYGRAGGGIINLATKQGTNTYHGTVFERYAGSGLDSIPGGVRGPFSATGFTKPRFDTHTFGFTGGGRILKDKLFVFGALEYERYHGEEQADVNLLPDAAGFAALQSITGPALAQAQLLESYLGGGSYLTQDLLFGSAGGAPVVATENVGVQPGCTDAPPAPGTTAPTCAIAFAGFERPNTPFTDTDTQFEFRIDYRPWERDSFTYRYLHDRQFASPDFQNNGFALAGFDTSAGGPSELAVGEWTHIFTPHLENELRLAEGRPSAIFQGTSQTLANPLNFLPSITLAGISGTTPNGSASFPTLGPNQAFPQGRREELYQFQDTLGYTRAKHSLRIGADIDRQIEIDTITQNALGTLAFESGGNGVTSLGNFLLNQLGPSGTATKTFGPTRGDAHGYRNGIFAQDDIKLSADLTVNLGVRYDYLNNPENSLKYPGVNPVQPFAPITAVVPIQNDYNNIAPRIGFAYAPHGILGALGDGKTVLRGGFGIFYDSTFSEILISSEVSAPNSVSGYIQQTAASGTIGSATGLISSIVPALSPLNSVQSEASNLVNPLTYQYNLGIERELPGEVVLAVRYVGTRGEKQFANQQYNYVIGTTGLRVDPARGPINVRDNSADSNYNGVEIGATHNFRHGFEIRSNYVFSKDLDDGSEVLAVGASSSYAANLAPGGRRQDYGPSVYDHRQFFSFAYVWTPRGFSAGNAFANAALGVLTRHWTVSGVSQLQSGTYGNFNNSGFDTDGDGSAVNDRPVLTNPRASLQAVGIDGIYLGAPNPGTYYDVASLNGPGTFVQVTPGQVHFIVPYGPANQFLPLEIGRNSFQGPGTTSHNLALEKGVGLSYLHLERGLLILRAEAQNVFNHNDNIVGDLNVIDAGAGFATAARASTSRNLVLWAKVQF